MRKADKRALGEAKAKREAEERRQSGLEAQRIARMREKQKREHEMALERERKTPADRRTGTPVLSQKERSTLLNSGINPSTGLVFSDYDMAEMERKANTPERRRLFERIRAGRAGTLNEQPPLGGVDDYVDPLPEMTVGDFKDMADAFHAKTQERMRRETATDPERALEFAKALAIGGFFGKAAEGLDRMAAGSKKTQEALKDYRPLDDASGEKDTRFPARFKETQEALKGYIVSDMTAAEEVYGMRRRGDSTESFQERLDRVMPLFQVAPGETEAPIRKFLNESGSSE